jgi:hypothetical protein
MLDVLAARGDGDSSHAAHAALRWVRASLGSARLEPGLVFPPQADAARPAAVVLPSVRMLRVLLTSLSWVVLH